MIWLLAHPHPSIPSVSSTGDTHRNTEKERQLADGRGGGGWIGAKTYNRKKAQSSKIIQYSLIQSKYTANKTKEVIQF
jgi:hypothetical protein